MIQRPAHTQQVPSDHLVAVTACGSAPTRLGRPCLNCALITALEFQMDISGLLTASAVVGIVAWLARQESLASARSKERAKCAVNPAQQSPLHTTSIFVNARRNAPGT